MCVVKPFSSLTFYGLRNPILFVSIVNDYSKWLFSGNISLKCEILCAFAFVNVENCVADETMKMARVWLFTFFGSHFPAGHLLYIMLVIIFEYLFIFGDLSNALLVPFGTIDCQISGRRL